MVAVPNTASRVFYPSEMDALGEAYYRSCKAMSEAGDVRFTGRQAHYTRETIARLIVGFASAGERDPARLSQAALREMNAL